MNHFGVETFDLAMSEPEKIDQWKMSKTGPAMKNVYKILVTQTYKGTYGNFELAQEVFAVQEKDEWKIVWDYNQ
jgi:DNA polymerase III delta prime subunit